MLLQLCETNTHTSGEKIAAQNWSAWRVGDDTRVQSKRRASSFLALAIISLVRVWGATRRIEGGPFLEALLP